MTHDIKTEITIEYKIDPNTSNWRHSGKTFDTLPALHDYATAHHLEQYTVTRITTVILEEFVLDRG